MTNELQTLDVAATIKDKIKTQFVDLIPDDAFTRLVEAEIHNFTEDKPGNAHRPSQPSPIRKIIQQELELRFTKQIKEELDKPEYVPVWTNCGYQLPQHFKNIVIEAAPLILEQMIGQRTAELLNQMRSNNY